MTKQPNTAENIKQDHNKNAASCEKPIHQKRKEGMILTSFRQSLLIWLRRFSAPLLQSVYASLMLFRHPSYSYE
ncbi:MAG: hypothetical protein ACJAQT_004631 [Akkermansiaceae bacterium]|jgi:hypothetical protein